MIIIFKAKDDSCFYPLDKKIDWNYPVLPSAGDIIDPLIIDAEEGSDPEVIFISWEKYNSEIIPHIYLI
jgi:hypothetical protein